MKRLLLILALILVPSILHAQAARCDNCDGAATTTFSGAGIAIGLKPFPSPSVSVYVYPGPTTNCSGGGCTLATTYTDSTSFTACGGGTQVTLIGSNVCVGTGDVNGNYGFWALPGAYQFCLSGAAVATQCYNVTLGTPPSTIVTANSYATLQAAVNAVGNCGTLVIPPGTYTPVNVSTSLIVIPSTETCFKIQGSGKTSTILDCSSLTSAVACITNNNGAVQYTDLHIDGLTIKGPVNASLDSRLIDFQWCVRCTITNINGFNGSFGVTFGSSLSTDDTIRDVYFTGQNSQGISISGTNHDISNFHIYNVDQTNLSNLHHGVYIQQGDGTSVHDGYVSGVPGFCVVFFSQSASASIVNYTMKNITCENAGQAASGVRGGFAFTETTPATGIRQGVMEGLRVAGTLGGNGIYVSAVQDIVVNDVTIRPTTCTTDTVLIQSSTGFTVQRISASNITIACAAATGGNGVRITVGTGTALTRCRIGPNINIDTVWGVGIYGSSISKCDIFGNDIENYNVQANSSNNGILLDTTSTRNRVFFNIVATATGTAAPIQTAAAADADNTIEFNDVASNPTATIVGTGTRTIIGWNKVNTTDSNLQSISNLAIGGGIATTAPQQGNTGYQHIRVAGCATAAAIGATCDTTVTWASAFANTSYTAVCSGDVVTSGVPILEGININVAKAAGSITVRTYALTAVAAQFTTIDCKAVHD